MTSTLVYLRWEDLNMVGDCEHCGGSGIEPHPEDPDYVNPYPSHEWDPQQPACRKCEGHGEEPDPTVSNP